MNTDSQTLKLTLQAQSLLSLVKGLCIKQGLDLTDLCYEVRPATNDIVYYLPDSSGDDDLVIATIRPD